MEGITRFSNYDEVIHFMYTSLPMFQKVGASAYKKDLTNTVKLLEGIGNPELKFKSVHIAGTNGKGSSSNYIAAILQSAGYKTGLYTSPHLKNFNERIRINGIEIPEQAVLDFINQNVGIIEEVKPSFFELTVAMAFQYFADEKVDIAVIEVGMGGRLDSTNVIHPEVSLITNISEDHQQWLGNTLKEIAFEKGGVIKKGVPVVISERQNEVDEVFGNLATDKDSKISFASDIYHASYTEGILMVTGNNQDIKFEMPHAGKYQEKNMPGVISVIEVLREKGWSIDAEALKSGIKHMTDITGLKGRWQILNDSPLTICDVGHNYAGVEFIVEQFRDLDYNKLHIVWGTVNDKDIDKVLELLPKDASYYFCEADIPRAMPVEQLERQAHAKGLRGQSIKRVSDAVDAARRNAGNDDLIFIGGSTFVVAEIDVL